MGTEAGLDVAVRTDTANARSGFDSLDFRYTIRDDTNSFMFATEAGYNGWGGVGQFFTSGDGMDDYSNPTSSFRINSSPLYPRSLKTGIALRNIRESIDHEFTVDLIVNAWQGTMTQPHTWFDSVYVKSNLVVASTAELTIEPGTTVWVDSGATLTINGTLTALGTSGSPITFRAKDTGERWNGLTINGGSVEMDYVTIQDFKDHGLYTEGPVAPVSIEHTTLNCSKLKYQGIGLRLWNSPTVTQTVKNTTVYNVPADSQIAGMYLYNCKVSFDGVTIEDCDHINSFIKKITGSIRNSTFKDRTEYYAVLFSATPNTPNFRCNTFLDLAPTAGLWPSTIFCGTGTSPSFGGEGDTGGDGVSNVITDSSAYLLTMQGTLALPVVDSDPPVPPQYGSSNGGKNNWKNLQANGKYFQWQSPGTTTYPCTDQWWADGVDTTMFTPSVAARWDFDPYSTTEWGLCGGGSGGGGGSSIGDGPLARGEDDRLDDNEFDPILADALAFEEAEDYAAAQELFRFVAENSSESTQRWLALTHVVVCESFTLGGAAWFGGVLDDMIALENSYESRVLGERLRTSLYQNRNEYDDAIMTCAALLSSGLTYEDSIYVAMDLVGLQLGAGEGGGSLDGMSATELIPTALRASDDSEALRIERDLFAQLNPAVDESRETSSVPTEFSLAQNYPNPFNPTTQIEYDLPEAVRVTLKVFNTLGQEVAVVHDALMPAGHHVTTWDGKSSAGADVATGLYIYQLKAGSFQDAKKMMLLR